MDARFFEPDDAAQWDRFCETSHGSTFLHSRRFLSYHGERFVDRSIIFEEAGRWVGIVPAAQHPALRDVIVSHPGITYGGVLHQGRLRGASMLLAFDAAAARWRAAGYARLQYKAIPPIYQRAPAQEDLYALFRLGASRYRCDLSSCIDLRHRLAISERRKRAQKKAQSAGIRIDTGGAHLPALWHVLADNLQRRHAAKPVHSFDEISTLAARFPGNIAVNVALSGTQVLAGVVLFLSDTVVHAQYIASSEAGFDTCALDLVMEHAIAQSAAADKRYFDFGISTEDQGRVLNEGLNQFKNEFGAGGVAYEFYEWNMTGGGYAA
jgi:hypothetical protein